MNFANIPDCVGQSCTAADIEAGYDKIIQQLNAAFALNGLQCSATEGDAGSGGENTIGDDTGTGSGGGDVAEGCDAETEALSDNPAVLDAGISVIGSFADPAALQDLCDISDTSATCSFNFDEVGDSSFETSCTEGSSCV